MEVLEKLRERDAGVILLTGNSDVPTAVRAMQLGAENFLSKPVDMTTSPPPLARGGQGQAPEGQRGPPQPGRVGPRARLARHVVGHEGLCPPGLAPRAERADHRPAARRKRKRQGLGGPNDPQPRSARQAAVRRGQLRRPERHLPDSELFGHEKGAFTDAKDRKQGLFEIADRGTIFLDEIGDLGLELQPKLLKVLETKTFRRLGGTREITVDVRLVAATNKDLAAESSRAGSAKTSTTGSA